MRLSAQVSYFKMENSFPENLPKRKRLKLMPRVELRVESPLQKMQKKRKRKSQPLKSWKRWRKKSRSERKERGSSLKNGILWTQRPSI